MLHLDHITIVAPSLDEGVDYVHETLGVELINGTSHDDMGTFNKRVKLGADCYLEVIASDPNAERPKYRRWFGLDRPDLVCDRWALGRRLAGWVARTDDISALLQKHHRILGSEVWLDNHFSFSLLPHGELPLDGVLPSVIDLHGSPVTAHDLIDQGVRLKKFVLEHPYPDTIEALFKSVGIQSGPAITFGPTTRLTAVVTTPDNREIVI